MSRSAARSAPICSPCNGRKGRSISLLKQLKGILTAAERGDLQTQFNTVKNQIGQLVAGANYQGTNLVNNSLTRLDTQFSERSSSRLIVTAQRLSTYQTMYPPALAVTGINRTYTAAMSTVQGSQLAFAAGATGLYDAAGLAGGELATINVQKEGAGKPARPSSLFPYLYRKKPITKLSVTDKDFWLPKISKSLI